MGEVSASGQWEWPVNDYSNLRPTHLIFHDGQEPEAGQPTLRIEPNATGKKKKVNEMIPKDIL